MSTEDYTIYYRYGFSGLNEIELTLNDTDMYDIIKHITGEEGENVWDSLSSSKGIAATHDNDVNVQKDEKEEKGGIGLVVRIGRVSKADIKKMKKWYKADWEAFDKAIMLKSDGELTGGGVTWLPNPLVNPGYGEEKGAKKNRSQMEFFPEHCNVGDEKTGEGMLWDMGIRDGDIIFMTPLVGKRACNVTKVKGFWGRLFSKSIYLMNPHEDEYEKYKPSKYVKTIMKRHNVPDDKFKNGLDGVCIKFLYTSTEKDIAWGGKVGIKDISLALNVKPGKVTKRVGWITMDPATEKGLSGRVEVKLASKRGFITTFVVYKEKPYMIEKNRQVKAGEMLVPTLDDIAKVVVTEKDIVNANK